MKIDYELEVKSKFASQERERDNVPDSSSDSREKKECRTVLFEEKRI